MTLGLERLKEATASAVLTATVSPAFAAKWLLPRIDRFQTEWPDTDVRLDTSLKLVDYVAHGINVGVRYGAGNWPGLTAEKLMEEEIFPVCSTALRDRLALGTPADLMHQTLIHDLSVDPGTGSMTWETWLRKAGVTGAVTQRGMRINDSAAVLHLGSEDALRRGRKLPIASDVPRLSGTLRLQPRRTTSMAYLQITLRIGAENRAAAAGIYSKYKAPFLDRIRGAQSKELLIRDEDVQVPHGFDSAANAKAYLESGLFNDHVVTGLKPLLAAAPEIRIYGVA